MVLCICMCLLTFIDWLELCLVCSVHTWALPGWMAVAEVGMDWSSPRILHAEDALEGQLKQVGASQDASCRG